MRALRFTLQRARRAAPNARACTARAFLMAYMNCYPLSDLPGRINAAVAAACARVESCARSLSACSAGAPPARHTTALGSPAGASVDADLRHSVPSRGWPRSQSAHHVRSRSAPARHACGALGSSEKPAQPVRSARPRSVGGGGGGGDAWLLELGHPRHVRDRRVRRRLAKDVGRAALARPVGVVLSRRLLLHVVRHCAGRERRGRRSRGVWLGA